jgi:cytochrome P450 family 6
MLFWNVEIKRLTTTIAFIQFCSKTDGAMAFLTFFVLLAAITFLIYLWIQKKFTELEESGIPYRKPKFPFGNLQGIGRSQHVIEIVQSIYDEFKEKGPICGIYFFVKPNIIVTDLDVVRDVLIRDFDVFHNRGLYSNARDDPIGAHLVTLEDQEWKNMRAKMTPTFTSGKMRMMLSTIVEISSRMIDYLNAEISDKELIIEAKDCMAKITTDVIGNVAFGLEINSIKDNDSQFCKMGRKIFGGNNFQLKALFLTSFRDLGRKLRIKLFPNELSSFFLTTIRDTVDYRIKNKIERNDFMNLLLKMHTSESESGSTLTFNELAAQCFVFFIAGFDPSSILSSSLLYNLALHQDVQEKLRNEIKSVMKKHNDEITYEGMKEMIYLQAVIDGRIMKINNFSINESHYSFVDFFRNAAIARAINSTDKTRGT